MMEIEECETKEQMLDRFHASLDPNQLRDQNDIDVNHLPLSERVEANCNVKTGGKLSKKGNKVTINIALTLPRNLQTRKKTLTAGFSSMLFSTRILSGRY